MIISAAFVAFITALQPAQPCIGLPTAPALDHVVLGVRNLDSASVQFSRLGFRLKQGRLHANSLLNRHVKFRDGTSIELMTVHGAPRDGMATTYRNRINAGEGGVYVALTVPDIAGPLNAAVSLRLDARRSNSGSWQFVSFPQASPAAAVFFGAGIAAVNDPDSLVSHIPDASGLAEAWFEGGAEIVALLLRLGAKRCGTVESPEGLKGERLGLSRGTVVILPRQDDQWSRVVGVVLRSRNTGGGVVRPHPNFWIGYVPSSP